MSKTELEEMGESTDDLAGSTSKLREEIKALTGVDIMADEKTYKSTAKIIQEIGAVWDKLSDIQRANVLEKLAGKTRASVAAGLLENYETIEDVIKSAEKAEGSALKENASYMDSIEGKLKALTNSVQEFWFTLLNSESVKDFIDLLKGAVDLGTKFIDIFGSAPIVIGGVGLALKKVSNTLSSNSKNGGGRARVYAYILHKNKVCKIYA